MSILRLIEENLNKVNYNNFYILTLADFKEVNNDTILKEIKESPDFISVSGSRYLYGNNGVYRLSNHWGGVASCYWTINDREIKGLKLGFCKLNDFRFRDTYVLIYSKDKEKILKYTNNVKKSEGSENYYGIVYDYYKYIQGNLIMIDGHSCIPSKEYTMDIELDK